MPSTTDYGLASAMHQIPDDDPADAEQHPTASRFPQGEDRGGRVLYYLQWSVPILATLLLLMAAVVLVGWELDSQIATRLFRNFPRVATSSAICFGLCGLSLLLQWREPGTAARRFGQVCASVVVLIALGTLAEYLAQWTMGVHWMALDALFPTLALLARGQMAFATGLNFLFLGSALLVVDLETASGARPSQTITLVPAFITLLALVGFTYPANIFARTAFYNYLAVPTVFGFVVLCAAVLCLRPDRGLMRCISGDGMGSVLARRLLIPSILLPAILSQLRLIGEGTGIYDREFGITLFVSALATLVCGLVWWNARLLDQSEEKRELAERVLRRSEHRFRCLVKATSDIVWTTGANGDVTGDISQWCAFTGQTVEEIQGFGWLVAVHPDDREHTAQVWQQALASAGPYNVEYRLRRADATFRHFAVRGVPVTDEDGSIGEWVGSCTDITEQRELEHMKDELVSTVSHELRTPLTSLRGFAELMLIRTLPEEKRHEYLTIIHKETCRLAKLINDFLDLQKLESMRRLQDIQLLPLEPLLRECIGVFEAASVAHSFRVDIAADLPRVEVDPGRIRQVVTNLLSNAVKYSPGGGEVTVGACLKEGAVLCWVKDSGIGIPHEEIPKLFTKFFRALGGSARTIGGTGLGLALVKEIVELHRGRIWVESEIGGGSTFYFTLQPEVSIRRSAEDFEAPDILLVEDDYSFTRLLQEHFEGLGFSVATCAYAEQALELARMTPPRLVLLDIHLAGKMGGWELLVTLKGDERLLDVPVLLVTMSDPTTRGLALRGADYVLKSADPEAIRRIIRRQLPSFEDRSILIADDDPVFRDCIAQLLPPAMGMTVRQAGTGREALRLIAERMPDLMLLDLIMDDVDGFEVLDQLRRDHRAAKLQVLVITAKDLSIEDKLRIRRRMASLVSKREARLEYFTEVVGRILDLRLTANAAE